jgi:pimeloyl-ACP methyl ester carboxylesterase
MDYSRPKGRQITIAVTRLKATDQAHRLGSLAVNPGGPGSSGYLLPLQLVIQDTTSAKLNNRYDLIGFDPRGVGYSTKVVCPELAGGGQPAAGPITEQEARQAYSHEVTANKGCAQHDTPFLAQLTTPNVARDLNQVRIALHETKISFLGISWGTALGAFYRSLFPDTVGRMWLDSVLGPDFRLDDYANTGAQATAADFSRMAAWIAARNNTYRFGTSARQVKAALRKLQQAYDGHPVKFTDVAQTVDGGFLAFLASSAAPIWPIAAQALKELRNAAGPAAPPTVKRILTPPPAAPPGTPEMVSQTTNLAMICNEESGRRDFGSGWAAYQQLLRRYPVTGRISPFILPCAGWLLPLRPWHLRDTGGPVELSGHRYEAVTPYVWSKQMQSVIGGDVLTVNDDIHGSATLAPQCATHVVDYFDTGRPDHGQCPGIPVPSATSAARPLPATPTFTPAIPAVPTWPERTW